ncbi:TPA: fimbria/pilus periplasmic chaperone [Enterobacter cloacae]|uniref:fimbrial biogenesis chaperone n=1 Tax=Enterobacter cloacae TaxID=550 RepID=UPI000BA89076|nr:fimbria/pilus periplasmic chaperone [Enterobacter cloacae]PAO18194.1 fimbrial assembly protein [Enterobacter cloacae]HAS1053842.1 fimbria/pilus periplasmic chaperone [Enterobacter cloacae]HAS1076286.1 fimbria/pilus periplasmic chaperone [Enterobacter cloacae]HAS1086850.1 fimbria/pilus periplasmic chaperone [Enterobacter cloacae]HAS1101181.1 fimbria/pilus periplasmic chaperone [Enterobacter cloacae]
MNLPLISKGLICLLGVCNLAYATVSPDRTRIIFNASAKSVSVRLINQSKTDPYLAQSWIEDKEGKKTREFISPIPPLLRIEPDEQAQVRLMAQQKLSQLPTDRETLFYYNMREIPPKAEQKNVMQIAMQSRLKLFWRPKAIELKEGQFVPLDKVAISRSTGALQFKNSSPYYITVGYIGLNGKTLLPGAESVMIEPFGQASQSLANLPAEFQVGYISDYGGLEMFKVSCNAVQPACQSKPVNKG